MNKKDFLPCPFCGSKDIDGGAFSISPDCYISCGDCGCTIETDVSWEGHDTEKSHDKECMAELKKLWNKRVSIDSEIEEESCENK